MTPPLNGSDALDAYLGFTLILCGAIGIAVLYGWIADRRFRRQQDACGEQSSPALR